MWVCSMDRYNEKGSSRSPRTLHGGPRNRKSALRAQCTRIIPVALHPGSAISVRDVPGLSRLCAADRPRPCHHPGNQQQTARPPVPLSGGHPKGGAAMLELLDRQQKLTANQWKIALAATLGDMLDFFDFFLIGFVLAFIVRDWHLTYGESGAILLASGISAPFGSLVYGWLADRFGRRKVMIATVLNFSLATGAMALTPDGNWIYLAV